MSTTVITCEGEIMQGKNDILGCPFCPAKIWAASDEDMPFVKIWMGRHLAKFHQNKTESYLTRSKVKPMGFKVGL